MTMNPVTPLPLKPANGGTGLTTLTAHGVLVGEGTSNVVLVGPDSSTTKVLTAGGSSADPSFQAPSLVNAIQFSSAVPMDSTGRLYPAVYAGAGGNAAPNEVGLGVIASLDADSVWSLRFHCPPVIPKGTLKLRLLALANATSGTAKVTVSDGVAVPAASPASSGNPSGVTLTAETQTSITWAASENDRYKEAKVTLTSSPSANNILVVALTFNTTSWTLAQPSVWIPTIIWE